MNSEYRSRILPFTEHEIVYTPERKITFTKDTRSNNPNAVIMNYAIAEKTICLNDLLGETKQEWIFEPVNTEFKVWLFKNGKPLQNSSLQMNIPELQKDETKILCALHEIGHAVFYDKLDKERRKKETQAVYDHGTGMIYPDSRHSLQIIRTHNFFNNELGNDNFKRLNERNAWAYALKTIRKLNILNWLDNAEIKKIYQSHLITYGKDFL